MGDGTMKIKWLKVGFLQCNCYILIKGLDALIIDPGDNFDLIEKNIIDYNVVGIIITHNHFDHIGALNQLVNKYDIKVYNKNNLKDKEYNIGLFNFEIISTPGHSSDSIIIYFKEEKIMFVGDFIFKNNVGRVDGPTSSYDDLLTSIKKIKTYDKKIVIYTGHGEKTKLIDEINSNPYFSE